jgi:NAD(P)-dependent dehydrogenase (short-subunit alcohol dehydrogenase family)
MSDWIERFSLKDRAALVTGATKGIGLETAKVLADAGADIAAVGRDPAGLDTVKAAVEAKGRRCVAVAADMATPEGPEHAAKAALAAFGTIDILVNNAGIALIDPLLEAKAADWDMTMAVNLRAPWLLARALIPGMIKQSRGKVINVSSQAGVVGLESHGAYAASKGGLNMLTKVMCVEWAKHNIQINSVCPTVILTPMGEQVWGRPEKGDPMKAKIPGARFGRPIEVADLILYLASSASDLVNGQDILIDGGYTAI